MKHLIIYAHPNTNSLNSHFKHAIVNYLEGNGHDVVVRDLYELSFNPALSLSDMIGQMKGESDNAIKQEQEHIIWADRLTFIYPIWWTGMPAMMKGYIDRVFSYGFAYRYNQGVQEGLLLGKSTIIINTQGKSAAEYQQNGMDKALLLTSDTGIYTYCGLEVKKHFVFEKANHVTLESVELWLKEIISVYQ